VAQTVLRQEMLEAAGRLTSPAEAPRLLRRAMHIARVRRLRSVDREELMRICQVIAAEGGLVQEIAEEIAVGLAQE
jgi:hypothetical protein